ncbi:MAG: aminoglycoside phosphotransferase family protein [Chloroflexota bacterium]|nr:aminoglycoside phosphotransferase family protein [Chloroflexota bacterium]
MHAIPDNFARLTAEVHGAAGVAWLAALPGLLADCERRWGLRVGPPFALSYNYVAPAVRADGSEVVLKLGVPQRELLSETAALQVYAGRGSVQLLAADPARGILLLERLWPGTPLVELADDAATAIAAQVMRELWQPVPAQHAFRTVGDWAAGLGKLRARFGGGTGPLPARLVALAEGLFAELLPAQAAPVVLHGDLHHWNIVAAQRRPWLALDPKGILGEPAYEVGAWLRNPLPGLLAQPDPARLQARRVAQFAEVLELDRRRLAAWGVAQAVLSAWWSIEDHGHGGADALTCAELLLPLL